MIKSSKRWALEGHSHYRSCAWIPLCYICEIFAICSGRFFIVQYVSKGSLAFSGECLTESLYCFKTDIFLHLKVVTRHIQVRMAHDRLDRLNGYTQRLKLTYISMSAAMGSKSTDIFHAVQYLLKLRAEMWGIARLILNFRRIPDEFILCVPKRYCTVLHHRWYRDRPITVITLGRSNCNAAFNSYKSLLDGNGWTVFGNMPRFKT